MKHLIFFTVVCFSLVISIQSCTKDSEISEDGNTNSTVRAEKPTVSSDSDGLLNFATIEDARAYLEILEDSYSKATDKEAFLINEMRSRPGETLLEARYGADLSILNETEIDDGGFDDYMQTEWMQDDLKMLMLNKDYEIGVAKDIYVWYDNEQVYQFPKADNYTRDLFTKAEKNKALPPIEILSQDPILHSESKGVEVVVDTITPPGATQRSFHIIVEVVKNNINCEIFLKEITARVYIQEVDDLTGGGDIELYDADQITINFGDNNSETFTDEDEVTVLYEYSTTGDFTVEVDVDWTIGTDSGSSDSSLDINVENSCSDSYEQESFWENNSSRAMSGLLRFDSDVLGKKFVAKTTGWRWKANKSKWVKERGAISAQATATFRNSDCLVQNTKSETDSCGNCKSKRVAKHAGFFHAKRSIDNGDVFSSHSASFGSSGSFSRNLVLNPC